jgi:thioredoxin reductase (NADPH)
LDLIDVLILGSGPAGLAAGIYAARSGMHTVLFEQGFPGGLASTTADIQNYPGFPEGIAGMDLGMKMYEQAKRFGAAFVTAKVRTLRREGDHIVADLPSGNAVAASAIVATGSTPRKLGVPGEAELTGRGVSYCATCDGPIYRDKTVAVVGGGDSALQEALFVARFASRVMLIHRRPELRAAAVLQQELRANPKVVLVLNKAVKRISGDAEVSGIDVEDKQTSRVETLPVDGVFIYVGYDPNVGMLGPDFKRSASGFLLTDGRLETSVRGVFAAGDVREKPLRQVATAVGDGATAAMSAYAYFESLRRHK